MTRVLKLIQLWHLALVPKSRHRDDLLHISDMYKLLQAKGTVCRSHAAPPVHRLSARGRD
jgi:hypothetical protein